MDFRRNRQVHSPTAWVICDRRMAKNEREDLLCMKPVMMYGSEMVTLRKREGYRVADAKICIWCDQNRQDKK